MIKNILFVFILIFISLVSSYNVDQKIFENVNRVVNGSDTDIENYSCMVSLQSKAGSHFCGGTAINPWWILTAAHCIYRRLISYTRIQYGSTKLDDIENSKITYVEQFVPNPVFNANSKIHDIGLIKVTEPMIISQFVVLPEPFTDTMHGTISTLIGWGRNGTYGNSQNVLQSVDLIVFSDAECRAIHANQIYSSNICSGVIGGLKGQCSGDSGGPLIVYGRQVGIVSWSVKPCTVPPYPGVYTQVSYYIDWIRFVTER